MLTDFKNGLFILLHDDDSLKLYLKKGVYGFLMPPTPGEISSRSMHYKALADYGCVRAGTHIFFFISRKIYYGGEAKGNESIASFYLNGLNSPMGRREGAPLSWDESNRQDYKATQRQGVFIVKEKEKCQPYIIQFEDKLGLKGKNISSDELYFELGKFNFPFPSNSIQNSSFCVMTPKEVSSLLKLITEQGEDLKSQTIKNDFNLEGSIPIFRKELGLNKLKEDYLNGRILNEAHLEFSILANTNLVGHLIEIKKDFVPLRQIPICPFKPMDMDRADIGFYDPNNAIMDGAIPNIIIELKKDIIRQSSVVQVQKYLSWLSIILSPDDFKKINAYLLAPKKGKKLSIDSKFQNKIKIMDFAGD